MQNNNLDFSKLTPKQFKEYIKTNNLNVFDKNGNTPLSHAFSNNKTQNLNLSTDLWLNLINKTNLKLKDWFNMTPIRYAIFHNKDQKLNLSQKQWEILINNSDLTIESDAGRTLLIDALFHYQNLNLSTQQWDKLFNTIETLKNEQTIMTTVLSLAIPVFLNKSNQFSIEQILKIFTKKNLKLFENTKQNIEKTKILIKKANEFYEINQLHLHLNKLLKKPLKQNINMKI
jgi:hypothetical protein